jgi:hypothetical protein
MDEARAHVVRLGRGQQKRGRDGRWQRGEGDAGDAAGAGQERGRRRSSSKGETCRTEQATGTVDTGTGTTMVSLSPPQPCSLCAPPLRSVREDQRTPTRLAPCHWLQPPEHARGPAKAPEYQRDASRGMQRLASVCTVGQPAFPDGTNADSISAAPVLFCFHGTYGLSHRALALGLAPTTFHLHCRAPPALMP